MTEWIGVACTLVGLVSAGIGAYLALYVRAEVADMRASFARERAEDKLETRNWINGSFMRAAVVEGMWRDIARRMDEHERRLENLEG